MKITDEYLRIQAYLDGELAEDEAREMKVRISVDKSSRELYEELRFASELFAEENEILREVPASRNAYWAEIRDAIEVQSEPAAAGRSFDWKSWLLQYRIPAFGVAVVFIFGVFFAFRPTSGGESSLVAEYTDVIEIPNVTTMSYFHPEQNISVTFIDADTPYLP